MFRIESMSIDDVAEVGRVERRCFSNPWPPSAYRRELQQPDQNYYIVLRDFGAVATADLPPLSHVKSANGVQGDRALPRRTLLPLALGRKLGRTGEDAPPKAPIIGFAGMWLAFDEAHITTIGIDPTHRGRGLGELLLIALFDEAFRRHTNWLTLEVRVSNAPAQALYHKYGFSEQGRRKRYYSDNNEDALIMWSQALSDRSYQERIERLRETLIARVGASPDALGLSAALPNGRRP